MNLNNTVIEALNAKHGRKIVEWFKSQGIDTSYVDDYHSFHSVSCGDKYRYYGVIEGSFENWSLYRVQHSNAKIITLPEGTETVINEPILNVLL